jgi:hypothetical protein
MKGRYLTKNLVVLGIVFFLMVACVACSSGSRGGSEAGSPAPTSNGSVQASGTANSLGGTIEVTDPQSPIKGAKVVVPPNALAESDGNVTISISYEDNLPAPMPNGSSPTSKTIVLTKDINQTFLLPVSVTVPYEDKGYDGNTVFAVLRWNSAYNTYEPAGVKAVDTTNKTITFTTINFSRFVVCATSIVDLPNVDTGFKPDEDGFLQPNFGTYDTGGAMCLPMSCYFIWYYTMKKKIAMDKGSTINTGIRRMTIRTLGTIPFLENLSSEHMP